MSLYFRRRPSSRVWMAAVALGVASLVMTRVAVAEDRQAPNAPAPTAPASKAASASEVVGGMIDALARLVEPPPGARPRTFTARLRVTGGDGLPKEVLGATADVAFQAPDRAGVVFRWGGPAAQDKSPADKPSGAPAAGIDSATASPAAGPSVPAIDVRAAEKSARQLGNAVAVCRDGQQLWVHSPGTKFGVIGKAGVPKFSADPGSVDATVMPPIRLPISPAQLKLSLMLASMESLGEERLGGQPCDVVRLSVPDALTAVLKLPPARLEVAVRRSDRFPARLRFDDGKVRVEVAVEDPAAGAPWPDENWKLHPREGDKVETVALHHLCKFFDVLQQYPEIGKKMKALGPATGKRRLVATSGKGRLELHDGTRVLFLEGTPEHMGRQQGELLGREAKDLVEKVLYGVGVGSSFVKGRWFFGEIEQAHGRLAPFISPRTYRELDALADATGVHRQEARLANFFPELFHCTGFAVTGKATADGHLYHGRVLDYLRGVGLEASAVVVVNRPWPEDGVRRHAWVNVGYAGFLGTVTAMNEKGISVGEMGGRGEGKWDGKPMAQLLAEVMERAGTLDEAVEIMRKGPRTCEYYYVIADGKTKQAVGIASTPDTFEMIRLGESHKRLPHAIEDTVLLSAGDRYEKLVERVRAGYGRFDALSARALMERPVCMTSNIQSVLFVPDTLDFYVANADAKNVASHTRYTKYNLRALLETPPAE